MSFRCPRSLAAALISAFLVSLSAGCAFRGERAGEPAENTPVATNQNVSTSDAWQVLDGGVLSPVLPGWPGVSTAITGPLSVRFVRPVAIAVRGPYLYIADAGLQRLFRYEPSTDRLVVLKELRDLVAGGEVSDIFVASDFSYYLADGNGGRIYQFDPDGNQVRVIEDHIDIGRPVGVAVDEASGTMYIADGFNDDVLVYNRAGGLEGAIGARGQGDGRFLGIMAMTLGRAGVYVGTRFGEERVQLMGYDGAFLKAFQRDTVIFPTSIAVDRAERAFVSDYLADNIKVFVDGELVDTLGGHGSAPGRFKRIADLAADGNLLYVADSLNGRIQMLPLSAVASRKDGSRTE